MYFRQLVKEEPCLTTTEWGLLCSKISKARVEVFGNV